MDSSVVTETQQKRIEGGMVGSGMRRIGSFGMAASAALVALALAPAVARAEPTVTIATPASGSLIDERPTTISGATSDTTDMVTLVVSREGSVVREESTTPQSGVWTLHVTLPDGAYSVIAHQTELATLEPGSSAEVFFTIDTTPPSLTLGAIPSVIATATPSFGGEGGQEQGDGAVSVIVDGKLVGEAPVSGGSWTLASAHLSDGTHTVLAEQSDEAGNVSKTSTATFRVDTTAPAPTVTGPKAGEKLKSSLVEFHGGAGSSTGDSTEVTVEVFKGESTAVGNLEQSFTAPRSGSSWSSGTSGPRLSNGTYTVRVKQLDSVGNTGESKAAVTFEVLSPAPSLTMNELPRFTNDATPSFSGLADVSPEAKPEVTVKVWRGTSASGSLAESASGAAVGGTWSLGPVGALSDGTYTAQAEQPAALAKNSAGVSETTTFTVDTEAPQPTLSAPGESTGLETVSGSAGTGAGDRRQVTAELFSGATAEGDPIETITVNDNLLTGTWSATFAGLGAGQYTVIARQSDEAGNTGSSAPQSFTVNAPPTPPPPAGPTPPVASFTWVPAAPTVGQTVSFVSKSTDGSTPITSYGWDVAGSGPFIGGGPLTTTSFSTAGAHTVRLQVSDANGLSSTVAETINVAPPVLKLMQPFPIVRIAGAETSNGARIKLLTVLAPPAAKVAVSCKGRGCKTKAETRVATASSKSKSKSGAITLAFPRFQRTLKAGAVLQIRISRSGEIGKFTSFTIRRNKLPVRVDACLRPSSAAPSACPSQ